MKIIKTSPSSYCVWADIFYVRAAIKLLTGGWSYTVQVAADGKVTTIIGPSESVYTSWESALQAGIMETAELLSKAATHLVKEIEAPNTIEEAIW